MKKYIFGISAVILAACLTAFSFAKPANKSIGTPYYWYDVNGTSTVGAKLNDEMIDKEGAISTQLTPCDDTQTVFCLYGSTNPNLSGFNFGGTPPEDQIIREN